MIFLNFKNIMPRSKAISDTFLELERRKEIAANVELLPPPYVPGRPMSPMKVGLVLIIVIISLTLLKRMMEMETEINRIEG